MRILRCILVTILIDACSLSTLPLVINTWAFKDANFAAWKRLTQRQGTYIEAVVEGCSVCEREQCDGTVGFGGSPDENGDTTLDAFVMDGATLNIGAVAGLRDIKDAISVAYHVLTYTQHSILVGESATEFAETMGFKRENLRTLESQAVWKRWRRNRCQPNFWMNVVPDARNSCGPYIPKDETTSVNFTTIRKIEACAKFDQYNHDTIGMIVVDTTGNIAVGTSTNGASYKIPGRIGDSPIPGAGAYADNDVGAATATGNGDIMMRFLPSFMAVERLRHGDTAEKAARYSILRIMEHYPYFVGAIIVADKNGYYSAACHGINEFPYSVFHSDKNESIVKYVDCLR